MSLNWEYSGEGVLYDPNQEILGSNPTISGYVLEKDFYYSGLEFIKLFFVLSSEFILLINVKMPTIVGILTFISRINYKF